MSTQRLRWLLGILLAAGLAAASCRAARRRTSRGQWQQPDRVVADLGLKDGSTIADIGAGRGYFTFRLGKAVGPKGKVYATEISTRAIRSVADRVEREKLTNIETVVSEPTDTKLTSACLDAAVICNVLHHVPKDKRLPLTKDIARALKPGGYLFIVDWRFDAKISYDKGRRIPRKDLVQLAADAGLTLDAEFLYLEHQVYLRCRKPKPPRKAPAGPASP